MFSWPTIAATCCVSTCRPPSGCGAASRGRPRGRRSGEALGLADPTRLTLAAALLDADELCVCDLAWIVERSQNLVSHHLRALRASGLVRSRRQGKMVMYALTDGRARSLVASVAVGAVARV